MKKFILIFFLLCAVGFPQAFNNGFNFYLPPEDTTTGRFLPPFPVHPIQNDEFVSVNSEGHFSVNGNPIRFWGGNIVAGAAFPDAHKLWFIAGRLRKMGFNLIRLHHIDNPWGNESLFEYGSTSDTRHLNPITLNKLDYLISELKKNGIYINMNLNVSRTFKTIDGVPYADSLPEFGKGVTQYDPRLIELEKEYATQLLTHVNPFTGLSLADDPVMAMVEMTNENSLYRMWRDNNLKPFAEGGSLTIRHTQMMDSMWIKYLKFKYLTTENLALSWNEGISSVSSINLIKNGDFESGQLNTNWVIEIHPNTNAVMSKDTNNSYKGIYSAKISVTQATGTAWHLQWKQVGITVKKDSFYTVEFAARADGNKTVSVSVMRDNDPYTFYTGQDFLITSEWKVFSFSFKAAEDNNGATRLTFQFASTGNYWFDDIKMAKPSVDGLLADESFEKNNIKRTNFSDCIKFSDNRTKDISEFYIDIQKRFFETMRTYLKDDLRVKVPIIGTNWNVGPADLYIQSTMDYIDNHSYWDHPQFPNVPWSSTDWLINNTPMVSASDGGTIPGLFAGVAIEGKPYTISEYNHAFPNRYQVEAPLFISAYSSFHYADGIMFFDYNGENSWETDKVNSYFSIHRNNALMSLIPSCAYAFRNGLISKANETLLINYSQEKLKTLPKDDPGGWMGLSLFSKKLALVHAVRNQSFNAESTTDFSTLPAEPVNPYITDTKEITYDTEGLLSVNTQQFIGLAGYLNTFADVKVGDLYLKSANDFGSITWLSLTDDSLASSERSLVTVSSKVQNTGMTWDGTSTIHNTWGNAPTQMYPLILSLELKIYADSIRIYPVNNLGNEDPGSYVTYLPSAPNNFSVTLDQNINHTTWFGIEKFGEGNISGIEGGKENMGSYFLDQNYPNPFNSSTSMFYALSYDSYVRLEIYDALGSKVKTLVDENRPAGYYKVEWNGSTDSGKGLVSGIYFAKYTAGGYSEMRKLVYLK